MQYTVRITATSSQRLVPALVRAWRVKRLGTSHWGLVKFGYRSISC